MKLIAFCEWIVRLIHKMKKQHRETHSYYYIQGQVCNSRTHMRVETEDL